MNRPPFEIPNAFKKASRWAERKVPEGYSDGDERHWPGLPTYRPSAKEFYLCLLGQKWAEKDGIAQPGIQYYLDRLPEGYAMFETDQQNMSNAQTYKRLFGHPSGRFYDSAARFEPHFQWLMSGMEGACECTLCQKKSNKPLVRRRRELRDLVFDSMSSSARQSRERRGDRASDDSSRASSFADGLPAKRSQRQVRQAGAPHATDEEGTEDIYKDCIKKLENAKGGKNGIEIDLTEDGSIDWKADRESLPQYLTQIEQQHSFVPRIGELVLWCPNFLDGHYLMLDPENSEYKFYSFEQKCFHGFPAWRGGIVAAAPNASVKNGPVDFPDILDVPAKKTSFNTAGFRIETMPDPNDDVDKSLSKQYGYVPLRNIRPLNHWQLLLKGIPQDKLHPSIQNALTCMTSLSLLEKHRFNGEWPNACISCKGTYLGSELITVGDVVRLLPSAIDDLPQPEVFIVSSIRYNMLDIRSEHAQSETPQLSGRSFISFVGRAYTTKIDHLRKIRHMDGNKQPPPAPLSSAEIKSLFRCVGADGYGAWYAWHAPHQKYEVSHERVLGRLYEADAVRLWTGQRQFASETNGFSPLNLHLDAASVLAGRKYATATDARLPEPPNTSDIIWHLADTRAESLAIATLNGIFVGKYHDVRTSLTLKQWRMQVKVADGQQIAPEVEAQYLHDLSELQLYTGARRGRPPGSKVVDGKLIKPSWHDTRDESNEEKLAKPSSQMAGAALAANDGDTSEEDREFQSFDNSDVEDGPNDDSTELLSAFQQARPARTTLSKADIMGSIEIPDDEAFDDDDVFSDDSDSDEPQLLARGGTEESEGGDYREE